MALQVSPLAVFDPFNQIHIEPHVGGLVRTQTRENPRAVNPNPLIIASQFRSGKPKVMTRFREIAALEQRHDPDNNRDQGVALARMSRVGFADPDVFGSADLFTYRVNNATPGMAYILASSTQLIQVTTGDYGYHVNGAQGGSRLRVSAGTHVGKKVVVRDSVRPYTLDDLGPLLKIDYTGNGSAATATIRRSTGVIAYSGQVADADAISVNGVIFEFDNNSTTTSGRIPVTIGANQDVTFGNLVEAINTEVGGVTATQDATANTVTLVGPEQGILLAEVTDSGSAFTVAHSGQSVLLQTTLTGATDGSQGLILPLVSAGQKTIALLVGEINKHQGYAAEISKYGNGALLSTGIDPVTGLNIMTAATLTGYTAMIADAINSRTQGSYSAQILVYGVEPDEFATSAPDTLFTGGTSPAATVTDTEDFLNACASELQIGGIILYDTDDPVIMNMVTEFCIEQRSQGKIFKAYFGANPNGSASLADRVTGFLNLSSSLDFSKCHLFTQRMGVLGSDGTIEYLHPIFLAAALAGAASGNLPYVTPLTNKRLRFVDIHPNDSFDTATRESLIDGGITVVKKSRDIIVVSLHVTTSHDPDRRMERIASERATVDLVDARMREAFLPFIGKWSTSVLAARCVGVMRRVLDQLTREGALSAGVDSNGNKQPAWEMIPIGDNGEPFIIENGQLKLKYQIFIGGELNHVDLIGNAEYARIVGGLATSAIELATQLPLAA